MSEIDFDFVPPSLEELNEERRRIREEELDDVKRIAMTEYGRRFLLRLFESGHIFKTTFRTNSTSAFLEGRRNLAQMFLDDLAISNPEACAEITHKLILKK